MEELTMLIKVMARFNQMETKITNLDFLRIKYEESQLIHIYIFSYINEDYNHFYNTLNQMIIKNLELQFQDR